MNQNSTKNIKNFREELKQRTNASLIQNMLDGTPKNENPLRKTPNSQMRLYVLIGIGQNLYFESKEDLQTIMKENPQGTYQWMIVDYIGNIAGRRDVIQITDQENKKELRVAINRNGYAVYNPERSKYHGDYIWEYQEGSLEELYQALRDSGVIFEEDVFQMIEDREREVLTMCEINEIRLKKIKDRK